MSNPARTTRFRVRANRALLLPLPPPPSLPTPSPLPTRFCARSPVRSQPLQYHHNHTPTPHSIRPQARLSGPLAEFCLVVLWRRCIVLTNEVNNCEYSWQAVSRTLNCTVSCCMSLIPIWTLACLYGIFWTWTFHDHVSMCEIQVCTFCILRSDSR